MRKRGIKIAFRVGSILAALAASAVVCFLLFTGPMMKLLLPAVSAMTGVEISARDISGNVFRGISLEGLNVHHAGVKAHIGSISIRLGLREFFRKKILIRSLVVRSPVVRLDSSTDPRKETVKKEQAGSGWSAQVDEFRLEGGTLLWGPPSGRRWARNIAAVLSYKDEKFLIQQVSSDLMGAIIGAQGEFGFAPLHAEVALRSKGAINGRAEFKTQDGHMFLASDFGWREGMFRLSGTSRGEDWKGSARFRNVSLRPFIEIPPWIAPFSGNLRVEGRGRAISSATGSANFSVSSRSLGTVVGTVQAGDGSARFKAALKGRDLSLKGNGTYAFVDRSLDARGSLVTGPRALASWTKAASIQARTQWAASGVWPRLKWNLHGEFEQAHYAEYSVEKGSMSVEGQAPESLFFDGMVDASTIRSKGRGIERARIAVSGSPAAPRFYVDLRSREMALTTYGDAERKADNWTVTFKSLHLQDGTVWESTAPFVVSASPGEFKISGFYLTDGKAVAAINAHLAEGKWETLRVRIDRFSSKPWVAAGLWPFPLDGVFSAKAELSGPIRAPRGTFRAELVDFRWKGHDLGRFQATGKIDNAVAKLDPLRWQSPGGTLTVRGSFPVGIQKGGLPPFDASVDAAEFRLAFLGPVFPKADLATLVFRSKLRVAHRSGIFRTHGSAELRGDTLRFVEGQTPFKDLRVLFEGKGKVLHLAEITMRSGDGILTGHGALRSSGPDIRLRTDDFRVNLEKQGFTGEANAELSLQGKWAAPALRGSLEFSEANFRPPEKKKEKKKEKKTAAQAKKKSGSAPSPLAIDLTVRSDRNVWYKHEDTAIETRANLRFLKNSRETLRLFGTVETVRGQYVYYGRAFEIDEGRLIFSGVLPPDPRLDVRALYLAEESGTRVRLHAGGTLRQPTLELSSEPPLSQQDILAVLLFGAPMDQAGAGGGAGGEAAVEVLSGYLVKELRETRLFRKLDIDVLRVRQTSEGEKEVTVGRYLTSDLYVAYEQTLSEQGQRRLRAEYALLPHWSLLGRTTHERYILDLLFKYDLN